MTNGCTGRLIKNCDNGKSWYHKETDGTAAKVRAERKQKDVEQKRNLAEKAMSEMKEENDRISRDMGLHSFRNSLRGRRDAYYNESRGGSRMPIPSHHYHDRGPNEHHPRADRDRYRDRNGAYFMHPVPAPVGGRRIGQVPYPPSSGPQQASSTPSGLDRRWEQPDSGSLTQEGISPVTKRSTEASVNNGHEAKRPRLQQPAPPHTNPAGQSQPTPHRSHDDRRAIPSVNIAGNLPPGPQRRIVDHRWPGNRQRS